MNQIAEAAGGAALGGLVSGSVGNVVEGRIDSYNAYNDYQSGNYFGATVEGVDAGVHFGEAFGEGAVGDDY